jgi:hypothetical protein
MLARVWPRIETLLKSHKLVNVYADRIEGIGWEVALSSGERIMTAFFRKPRPFRAA